MRASTSDQESPVTPRGSVDDLDQSVSDVAAQRLLKAVIVVLIGALVVGLFSAAAIWALGGDDAPPAPMNAVDVGFLQDMLDHHAQALVIADAYLAHNPEGGAAPYAREVIMYQTRDMGWMRDWLSEEGYAPGAPDRTAMTWMAESSPVADMPGMQTPERIQGLADARGTAADRLFFDIMTEHHLGGVHMADAAAANGARKETIKFAESVSRNQRIEVDEYNKAMVRLGLT